jgi:hypothetical protein
MSSNNGQGGGPPDNGSGGPPDNRGPPPHVRDKLQNLPIGPGNGRGPGQSQGRGLGIDQTIAGQQRRLRADQVFGVSRTQNSDAYAYRIEVPGDGVYSVTERDTRLPSSELSVGGSDMYVRETEDGHVVEIAYKEDLTDGTGNGGQTSGDGEQQTTQMHYNTVTTFR